MRNRPALSLFLAAAILAGQWLAAVHNPDHGLSPGAAHACAVCVYAHGAGNGALPSLPRLALVAVHAAPESRPQDAPPVSYAQHPPIRGPPTLL